MIRTLEVPRLHGEVGHDPGPGHATLFGTTPLFLERLGLDSLSNCRHSASSCRAPT